MPWPNSVNEVLNELKCRFWRGVRHGQNATQSYNPSKSSKGLPDTYETRGGAFRALESVGWRVADHHADVQQVSGTRFNAMEHDDAPIRRSDAFAARSIFAGVGGPPPVFQPKWRMQFGKYFYQSIRRRNCAPNRA
jgi:hypothetical protein